MIRNRYNRIPYPAQDTKLEKKEESEDKQKADEQRRLNKTRS